MLHVVLVWRLVRRRSSRNAGRAGRVREARATGKDEKMAGKSTQKKGSALSKSALVNAVVEASGEDISRRQVKAVLEAMASIGYKELKRNGIFTVPGFAKFRVVKKPATKEREGKNPFTGEPMVFKAKPASKSVRARPIKAIKDALS